MTSLILFVTFEVMWLDKFEAYNTYFLINH